MRTRWTAAITALVVVVSACSSMQPGYFDEEPTGVPALSTIDVYERLDDSGENYLVTVGFEGPVSMRPILYKRVTDGPVASFAVPSGEYTVHVRAILCSTCELDGDEVTNGTLLDVALNDCEAHFGADQSSVTVRFDADCTAAITGNAELPLP